MDLYFAPMEGITGYLFRSAHRRWFGGVDRYFMPFFTPSQEHAFTRRAFQDLLPEHNQGLNAVPQLLTRRAEDFLWAAGELKAMGYGEVNLNLGCPSGTVVAKGKGSGLLKDLAALDGFLEEVFAHIEMKVSVKTRLGLERPEEFPAILEVFNRYPIAELTIHPRVQRDLYKNRVHLAAFEAALPQCVAPVCYNGDLVTAAEVHDLAGRFPQVGAVMLGRGLVGDPALARKVRGGPAAAREELRGFHDEVYEGYSAAFGSRRNATLRMKELWFYLIHLFADGDKLYKRLKKARDPAEFESAAAAIFRELELRQDSAAGWLDR